MEFKVLVYLGEDYSSYSLPRRADSVLVLGIAL